VRTDLAVPIQLHFNPAKKHVFVVGVGRKARISHIEGTRLPHVATAHLCPMSFGFSSVSHEFRV
jgi:hypothetical protein